MPDPHHIDPLLRTRLAKELGLRDIHFYASGTDFHVYRAEDSQKKAIALRLPKTNEISDGIDDGIDAVRLLHQEAVILRTLERSDIPVPRCYGVIMGGAQACLVMDFLAGDGAPPAKAEVGRTLRRIHAAPPAVRPVAQVAETANQTVVVLLDRRLGRLNKLLNSAYTLPPLGQLLDVLNAHAQRRSLLHLDVRPANFIALQGKVIGVLDWSNSLIGDPWLDLLRAEEFGEVNDEFWSGYGSDIVGLPCQVEVVYRLYTVVMLALLFRTLVPDVGAAGRAERRLCQLIEQLWAC